MTTYCYFVRGAKHAALAEISIASVRKVDKKAQVHIWTDEPAPRWKLDGAVFHIPPGMPIMLANLEAQVAALFTANPDNPIVFLDSDTILLGQLPHSGDLTVTWRDHVGLDEDGDKVEGIAQQMPYNYGVMVANFNQRTAEAFIWLRERIRVMHQRHQLWYGNQLALAELAGPPPKHGCETQTRTIPWMLTQHGNALTVHKVPCDLYNYTPKGQDDNLTGIRLLHFKGGSRGLMQGYAERLGLVRKEAA